MEPRWKKRLERIKKKIPIEKVLSDYGYDVHSQLEGREEQFSCDLHGDGNDGKPSARVYSETNTWYCFGCSKIRDAVDTVQAKEGLTFKESLTFLEKKYGLPVLSWEGGVSESKSQKSVISNTVSHKTTWEDSCRNLNSILRLITIERPFSMEKTLTLWELFDKVCWLVGKEHIKEKVGIDNLVKLKNKILEDQKDV